MKWETVIGLEVHVQLATQSKIFSGASTAFGAEPNTQACAIDLGLPGVLPVLNEEALRYAIMFGLAINADINKRSVFDRKNYFYPDLPKGYQTTQMDHPIVGAGEVEIQLADGNKRTVRIHHAHLEEDAGKSLHEDFHNMSGIDLNRAGTPLIEIVSEPDMRNAEEAVAYARKLHSIVTSLGICDGEMSQGSMRFDVNISVRPQGEREFGTRTETKNLNSFKFMEEAIEKEVARQIEVIEACGADTMEKIQKAITQETRLYNGETGEAKSMRSKEEANDYRYFPCPDLLPVEIDDAYIDVLRDKLPELPDAREARFIEQYQLSAYDASILADEADMASFFEAVCSSSGDAKLSANWCMGELSARLNAEEISIRDIALSAEQLGTLIARITDGTISSKMAKDIFDTLWKSPDKTVDAIIEDQGGGVIADSSELEGMIDEVIANSDKQVENYRKATEDKRPKMLGYFVGQVMKLSQGKAEPKQVNEILLKKLNDLL